VLFADVRMLASLTRTLRDLSGFSDGEPAGGNAVDEGALAAARRQMDNKEALREADERMGFIRALVDYTRSMRKYEATLSERAEEKAQAQEAKAKEPAETDQMRLDLARRIHAMVAARRDQQEAAQDQRPSIAKS
jgi:lysozyme family protein